MKRRDILFRLKIDNIIVGYQKINLHKKIFYSKDLYAWSSNPIEYLDKDIFSGYLDRNNRKLFVSDIVYLRTTEKPKPGILCEVKQNEVDCFYYLENIDSREVYLFEVNDIVLIQKNELSFKGYRQ